MSDVFQKPDLRLDDFHIFVENTRIRSLDTGWKLDYSEFIKDEEMEFLCQHGFGSGLLLPEEFGVDYVNAPNELRFGMADELGDLVWFNIDTASRIKQSIGTLCLNVINTLTDEKVAKPETFKDIGNLATDFGEELNVPNKLGLIDPNNLAGFVSVADHPGYVLMRSSHRVRRSLDQGINDLSPPVATELEDILSLESSLGFHMLVLAYIAEVRLRINISEIAEFTMKKLENRAKFGKENDIHFTSDCIDT